MVAHRGLRSVAAKTGPGLVFSALGLFAAFFLVAILIFIVGLAVAFIISAVFGEE
jgi:hypothetical protein